MSIHMSIASIMISMLTLLIAYKHRQYNALRKRVVAEVRMTPLHTRGDEPVVKIVSVKLQHKALLVKHIEAQNLGWTHKYQFSHVVLLSDDMEMETLRNPNLPNNEEASRIYHRVDCMYRCTDKPVIDIANTGPYTLHGWRYIGTLCTHYLVSHADNHIYFYTIRKKPFEPETV